TAPSPRRRPSSSQPARRGPPSPPTGSARSPIAQGEDSPASAETADSTAAVRREKRPPQIAECVDARDDGVETKLVVVDRALELAPAQRRRYRRVRRRAHGVRRRERAAADVAIVVDEHAALMAMIGTQVGGEEPRVGTLDRMRDRARHLPHLL